MPERYSMKTPSKWFRLFHQIEKGRLHFSESTTTLQFPIETNENNWCSLTKGCHDFNHDEYHFIQGTVHHKNENCDSSSLFRKNQKCSCVKCTRVIGNFLLMLSTGIYHLFALNIKISWFGGPAKKEINCLCSKITGRGATD